MPLNRENIFMIIGAVVVTLLQITLASSLTIMYATPNFMLAYAVVVAVIRPNSTRMAILAFAMGILYNLLMGGPLGALAVALILVCLVAGRCMAFLDNGTAFMPIVTMMLSLLVVELLYAFLTCWSTGINLGEALLFRAAPCFVYDLVLGFIMYFIMSRVAAEPDNTVSIGGPTLLR
ncbi:MAG: rod shape-determining protein MreD [Coriobacteriia bacterium]|nr:rod shape-determining protein MreD [Coriobacteriia bacterium]